MTTKGPESKPATVEHKESKEQSETPNQLNELVESFVVLLKELFKDTPLGGFLNDFLEQDDEVAETDPTKLHEFREGSEDLLRKLSVHELLMKESDRPGFLANTFLRTTDNKYQKPSFSKGDTYRVNFAGHTRAEQGLGLADLLPHTSKASLIEVKKSNGEVIRGKRILVGIEPMYVQVDESGAPLKNGSSYKKLLIYNNEQITILEKGKDLPQEAAEKKWQSKRIFELGQQANAQSTYTDQNNAVDRERNLAPIPQGFAASAKTARANILRRYGNFSAKCYRVAEEFRRVQYPGHSLDNARTQWIRMRDTAHAGMTMEEFVNRPQFANIKPGTAFYCNLDYRRDDRSTQMSLRPHWITYLGNGRWLDNTGGGENMSTSHMLQVLRGWAGRGRKHYLHSYFPAPK